MNKFKQFIIKDVRNLIYPYMMKQLKRNKV